MIPVLLKLSIQLQASHLERNLWMTLPIFLILSPQSLLPTPYLPTPTLLLSPQSLLPTPYLPTPTVLLSPPISTPCPYPYPLPTPYPPNLCSLPPNLYSQPPTSLLPASSYSYFPNLYSLPTPLPSSKHYVAHAVSLLSSYLLTAYLTQSKPTCFAISFSSILNGFQSRGMALKALFKPLYLSLILYHKLQHFIYL